MERELREIDSIKSLIDYIQKNLNKNYKLEDLKWALINQGHSRVSVDKAINYVQELEKIKKPKQEEPKPEVLKVEPVQVEEKKSLWQKIKSWFS